MSPKWLFHVNRDQARQRVKRIWLILKNRDPVKPAFDLADIVPKTKRNWTQFSHLMITHGRQICKARKPNCPECPAAGHCPALAYSELM
jgi:endonuclease-3